MSNRKKKHTTALCISIIILFTSIPLIPTVLSSSSPFVTIISSIVIGAIITLSAFQAIESFSVIKNKSTADTVSRNIEKANGKLGKIFNKAMSSCDDLTGNNKLFIERFFENCDEIFEHFVKFLFEEKNNTLPRNNSDIEPKEYIKEIIIRRKYRITDNNDYRSI